MRVMVIQSTQGLSAEEARERRAAAVAKLKADGHQVVGIDFLTGDNRPLWHLRRVLKAISAVDIAYFMAGWENDSICRQEYQMCIKCGVGIWKESKQPEKRGIKETLKRFIWKIKAMWAFFYYRGVAAPLLICGYPDGYAPYEKGYDAYDAEKKRYEEKLREFYMRSKRVKRRSKITVLPSYLIRRKKSSYPRKDGCNNSTYKPKNVNRSFIRG